MARSRNIKPGFFKNEILASLDAHTRLFFAGLWTIADREGRFEVRLEKIKAEIFPHEQVMLDSCMIHLWDKQFITLYEVGGKRFGQVNNWHKHQTPHHKEVPSQIPSCEQEKVFNNQEELQAWLMHDSCMSYSRFKKNASSPLIPDSLNLIPDSYKSTSHPIAGEKFKMFAKWKPSEHLPDLAKQSGISVSDAKLAEFIAHWLTQPHQRSQAEWDKALLQSARHDKLHNDSKPLLSGKTEKFDPVAFVNGKDSNIQEKARGRTFDN